MADRESWGGRMSRGRAVCIPLIAILASGMALADANEWSVVGPEGGAILSLVIDPQDLATFYAATGVGVFKTRDGGATWSNAGSIGFGSLVIDPRNSSTLYGLELQDEGSVTTRLFKSTDGGATWYEIFWLPPSASMLTIDPLETATLYAVAG